MIIDDYNNIKQFEEYSAILVGVSTGEDIAYSMEELEALAQAANINVLASMVQTVRKINATSFMGSGKLEELKEMCSNMGAGLIVFNDELSGMQLRNIEDACEVRVIDRTILILDIFADRASSAAGKLQVELAQLQYRLPRLVGFGKSLSRLGGGIGTRGPGEKKLETDRRHINRRMREIKKELVSLKTDRSTQRARREKSGIPLVALVGYTNSGKSSLMNLMLLANEREKKQVFEKDMLFATLDTAQRLISMDDNKSFILIDTVGFVDRLPHTLIRAFMATLEEVTRADLLIHVADASFPDVDFHTRVTREVLKELGADERPCINIFNKIDLVPDFSCVGYGKDALGVSAKTGQGLEELMALIRSKLFANLKVTELLFPYNRGDAVSAILEKSAPLKQEYRAEGTYIKAELGEADRNRYAEYIIGKEKSNG